MSIRIALDDQPEFYTNLDTIQGRIVLNLNRAEQVGGIIVKLEGESKTALSLPTGFDSYDGAPTPRLPGTLPPGNVISESHKILYNVQQVFPTYEDDVSSGGPGGSFVLPSGQHDFQFKFKLPLNNACSDPVAMSKMGGLNGVGGFGAGGGIFGLGGMRVMDGSKQLFLAHVTKTLPPSFTGLPQAAEARYFIKVTIQRPGLLRENWRYQIGFKFMPIEPPRPAKNTQEAFAKRPYSFRPRPESVSMSSPPPLRKRSSLFLTAKDKEKEATNGEKSNGGTNGDGPPPPPAIEMSARLPHPSILTCNHPIPLRLVAKKLSPSTEQVYLTSIQVDLIGTMHLRAQDLRYRHPHRWTVLHKTGIELPLLGNPATDAVGSEHSVRDDLWRHIPLPNTVAPSFETCNISRTYELELKLGLSWGKASTSSTASKIGSSFMGRKDSSSNIPPQTIYLPLHFSKIQVYSGIAPPAELVQAIMDQQNKPSAATVNTNAPPRLPPRTNTGGSGIGPSSSAPPVAGPSSAAPHHPERPPAHDPLYPPQLGTAAAPAYDDAPPSYDDAMAEQAQGPFDGMTPRPAYSGVTNENAPSQIPEKN